MRTRGLVILVLALPLSVRAQADAPADPPPAVSEEGGAAAPSEGAAPAEPPPEVASPAPTEPAPVAPAQAPNDAQPPAEASPPAETPAAPAASPSAPAGFTPSSSPLLAPSASALPPPPPPPPPTTYPPLPPPGAAPGYAPSSAPWWAPPPNYALVPLAPGGAIVALSPQERARREEVYKRLRRVDLRLYQLRRERASVGGPVTMMVLGYGAALIAGSRAIAAFHDAKQMHQGRSFYSYDDDLDYNGDGYVDHDDQHALRRTARAMTGLAAGGLALGLIGTAVLVRRLPRRRAIKQERRSLLAERNSLRQQLYYGAGFSANTFQLSLRGRF